MGDLGSRKNGLLCAGGTRRRPFASAQNRRSHKAYWRTWSWWVNGATIGVPACLTDGRPAW